MQRSWSFIQLFYRTCSRECETSSCPSSRKLLYVSRTLGKYFLFLYFSTIFLSRACNAVLEVFLCKGILVLLHWQNSTLLKPVFMKIDEILDIFLLPTVAFSFQQIRIICTTRRQELNISWFYSLVHTPIKMSQSLMHRLRLGNSMVKVVASHTHDGLVKFQYFIVASNNASSKSFLPTVSGHDFLHARDYSTFTSGSSTTDALDIQGGNLKKLTKLPRRGSTGNFNVKQSDNTVRTPPPIINSLPSRKPLHHSTDVQGTLRQNPDNSVDLKEQLKKAYDDALHFCHCKCFC